MFPNQHSTTWPLLLPLATEEETLMLPMELLPPDPLIISSSPPASPAPRARDEGEVDAEDEEEEGCCC